MDVVLGVRVNSSSRTGIDQVMGEDKHALKQVSSSILRLFGPADITVDL
jgi:hypothetical protein